MVTLARHPGLDGEGENVNNHSSSAGPSSARPSQRWVREGPFRFLDLPKELRLKVYEYIPEVSKQPLPFNLKQERDDEIYWRKWTVNPAILSTSKMINDEASAILRPTVNKFRAEDMILEVYVNSAPEHELHVLSNPNEPLVLVNIAPVVYNALYSASPYWPSGGYFLAWGQRHTTYFGGYQFTQLLNNEADRLEAERLLNRMVRRKKLETHLLYDSNVCSVSSISLAILQVVSLATLPPFTTNIRLSIKVAERGIGELLSPAQFAEKHRNRIPLEYFNMLTRVSTPPRQIVELIENIFQHLPFTDVISAKRVCKHWRDIIDDSFPIQQQLFFAPLTKAPTLRVPGFLLPKSAAYLNDAVY
ncbi:uncharacterized protein BDZ99DRAFT_527187 [Mytilinidion resinicola]|uniref:F-box domain-containing protein n=1 Tax=Mytilinidion resinicola TaxID=574789 RepID=A0A6A6Y1U9_9PEZI|nr:uncharacterized protein BDZ99DRAFT_527187 [Mytilinidion resinicola]KAF2802752.1 hypothetical protein BDZ99DRAFT_527187 [Mytilinidion resinicola]